MKNRLILAYSVGIGQIIGLLMAIYMIFHHHYNYVMMFRRIKVHLSFQFVIGAILLYGIYHFIRVKKISSKMRKAAQEQREDKSKRIEILIFALLLSLLFFSLFYTVPGRRYPPYIWEYTIYFINSALQLFLLTSLFSSTNELNKKSNKSRQRYAITGAVSGLILFYVYYQLMI